MEHKGGVRVREEGRTGGLEEGGTGGLTWRTGGTVPKGDGKKRPPYNALQCSRGLMNQPGFMDKPQIAQRHPNPTFPVELGPIFICCHVVSYMAYVLPRSTQLNQTKPLLSRDWSRHSSWGISIKNPKDTFARLKCPKLRACWWARWRPWLRAPWPPPA